MTKSRTNADNALADIVGVTAGTGITGGGTSGTVTVTNDMATAIAAKGDLIVGTANDAYAALTAGTNEQRLVADSATATGLKYVADTTNYAIGAKGDILAGTAADTVAALGVGTNGQVLTAASTTATGLQWVTPDAGSMTQLATGTLSGSQVDISNISSAYRHLQLQIKQLDPTNDGGVLRARVNDDSGSTYRTLSQFTAGNQSFSSSNYDIGDLNDNAVNNGFIIMNWYDYANTTTWKIGDAMWIGNNSTTSSNFGLYLQLTVWGSTNAINKINLFLNPGGDFAGGTYILYGVK